MVKFYKVQLKSWTNEKKSKEDETMKQSPRANGSSLITAGQGRNNNRPKLVPLILVDSCMAGSD